MAAETGGPKLPATRTRIAVVSYASHPRSIAVNTGNQIPQVIA